MTPDNMDEPTADGAGPTAMLPVMRWLERLDPGTHRRIKGLRLVTAYGIAALLGAQAGAAGLLPAGTPLSMLAGNFALWASVSEGRTSRWECSRDLVILCAAAALGALSFMAAAPYLQGIGWAGPEMVLATGAFLVGYLRRLGILGAGLGSQVYIGQLLAYGAGLTLGDVGTVGAAGIIAMLAAVIPRVLSGPAEHPAVAPGLAGSAAPAGGQVVELVMGLQAALAAVVIVGLSNAFHLLESAWAITACTYVVANSTAGTVDRIRRRIIGTVIGVPLGLLCLPLAEHAPLVAWLLAAVAMVVYAMALPERYDIACGAFAFTLVVTLAVGGLHSPVVLAARAWETLVGGAVGLAAALLALPLRARPSGGAGS